MFSYTSSPQKRQQHRKLQSFHKRQQAKKRCEDTVNKKAAADALMQLACDSGLNDEPNDHHDKPKTDGAICIETDSTSDSNPKSKSCETEMKSSDIDKLVAECQSLRNENLNLKSNISVLNFDSLKGNDGKVKMLTGLSMYSVLLVSYHQIEKYLSISSKLSSVQQFFLTLLRLRFNLSTQFLSYMFDVHQSTVSRIFASTIDILNARLVPMLVFWPEREQLRKTIPMKFRRNFHRCACIIDCFEVFIERPSDLKARAQTYSSYKSHNTVKYLIGITPQGMICFVSKGWGGRTSDKYLTENSTFLDNLLPGDVVSADRGFDIEDSVGLHNAELKIPAFTKGKQQLCPLDVESTREIACHRIHVERVIGVVRQKYTILQSTIPVTMLAAPENENFSMIDKIVRVACALTNTCDVIVPFD